MCYWKHLQRNRCLSCAWLMKAVGREMIGSGQFLGRKWSLEWRRRRRRERGCSRLSNKLNSDLPRVSFSSSVSFATLSRSSLFPLTLSFFEKLFFEMLKTVVWAQPLRCWTEQLNEIWPWLNYIDLGIQKLRCWTKYLDAWLRLVIWGPLWIWGCYPAQG